MPRLDGGYGWVVVVAGCGVMLALGNVWSAFGLLYPEFVDYYSSTKAAVGWVGSLSIATGNLFSVLHSAIIQRYGVRVGSLVGTGIFALGLFLSAFAPNVYTLYFTFGLLAGGGSTMVLLAVIVAGQQYFVKRRTLASGLILSGLAVGNMVGGPLVTALIQYYGAHGTLLILAAVVVQTLVFCSMLRPIQPTDCDMSANKEPLYQKGEATTKEMCSLYADEVSQDDDLHNNRQYKVTETKHVRKDSECNKSGIYGAVRGVLADTFDFRLLRDVRFLLLCAGTMLQYFSMWAFLSHYPSRALYYQVTPEMVALMVSVDGLASCVARLVCGLIGVMGCVNRTLFYSVVTVLSGANILMFTAAKTVVTISVVVVVASVLSSFYFTLQPTVVVDLLGLNEITQGLALLNIFKGVGGVISTPLIGFLFDISGDYDVPFYLAGGTQLLGGVLCLLIFCVPSHKHLWDGTNNGAGT